MFFLLEKLIFFGLIFSLPFQKRIFLFGPAVAGEGFFEWSSGFLYATDIFVILLFAFWIKDIIRTIDWRRQISLRLGPSLFLFLFLGFAFISLTQAELVDVGVYRFGKLAEFIFLFFYIAYYVGFTKSHIKQVLWVFIVSGVFQSILAILQFARQSSLGLEIFHESTLQIGFQGVAQITAQGIDMIRAYGTFPSPNVLAGFLGICLLFAFLLFLKGFAEGRGYSLAHSRPASAGLRGSGCFGSDHSRTTMPKQPSNPRESNPAPPLMCGIAIFLLSFGFLLTFSRGVVIFFVFISILFFAGMFLFKKFKEYRTKTIYLLGSVIVSWLLVIAALWPEVSARFLASSVGEPAIQERLFFNEVGVDTLRQNYARLFFGVGMGNFVHNFMESVPGLPAYLYQPAHNIFILIASEIGVFGLIAFIMFLAMVIKNSIQYLWGRHPPCLAACLPAGRDRGNDVSISVLLSIACFMILIGMYDHYFWTLQQGGLMFWVVLGLIKGATKV